MPFVIEMPFYLIFSLIVPFPPLKLPALPAAFGSPFSVPNIREALKKNFRGLLYGFHGNNGYLRKKPTSGQGSCPLGCPGSREAGAGGTPGCLSLKTEKLLPLPWAVWEFHQCFGKKSGAYRGA